MSSRLRTSCASIAVGLALTAPRAAVADAPSSSAPAAPPVLRDPASAAPSKDAEDADAPLPAHRNEHMIVPDAGGNSDIGAEAGVSVFVAHFRPGYYPYRWRMDAVAEVSLKSDARGFRPVQQSHSVRFDIPGFLSPRLRLDVRANFLRQVNASWFGVGNDTAAVDLPRPEEAASAYDYIARQIRVRSLLRITTGTPFTIALAANVRYEFPETYVGSKLESDARSGGIIGLQPTLLETVAAGFIVDTRDEEFIPHRGVFYQVGVGQTLGTREGIAFGEVSAVLSHYAPLVPKKLTFASRMIGSFKFGDVPFYELQQGGVFDPIYLVGGYRGMRGAPLGRYAGAVKAVANHELRLTPIPRFRVFGFRLLVGMNAFFDAARVFSDYAFGRPEDGRRLGLKWASGGGFFFQWDAAGVFRVEAAYSPEAAARGFPVAFYLENGLIF